ncbi:site-specific DNA-methyltransferase [uncultured Lutibacter sp.]|uniref:DNA-methyltransferase n=1 Tax=uncultured Lutibacter sp. TaxID=437739 RepID=UPI0026264CC2|nr:site-specific DNA-methyltransferase [uncultured Lutibacter sp.]
MIELRLGDCLEVMKTIESNSIDAIICDPPYGTTACKWDSVIDTYAMWHNLNRIIKPNGAIVLFGSEPFSSMLRMSNIKNYKYDWVWDKKHSTNFMLANKQPLKYHENIMVFNSKIYYPIKTKREKVKDYRGSKNEYKNNNIVSKVKDTTKNLRTELYPKSIIEENSQKAECNNVNRLHPTQKPIALMEYLIKTYTKENETVLDFAMGSGTTMVACKNTNRHGIGIEKDAHYMSISVTRVDG